MSGARIAVVVSGFPRRSETFLVSELLALQRHDMLAAVLATKPGERRPFQPGVDRLWPVVHVLQRTPAEQPAEAAERLQGLSVTGVHAYFAHAPAALAASLAVRLGVPWGFSMHAKDARKAGPTVLRTRALAARCVTACNADVARELDGAIAPELIPHGVDLRRFRPRVHGAQARGDRVRLLAVGRLVEKKGFHVLLAALRGLDDRVHLRIVGDGPERRSLAETAASRGLTDRVSFAGALNHSELSREYQRADVVVVPSIVDSGGDRDGLPNVVLEAMASGCPVVASDVGAIASAVRDGITGRLVPPGDPDALRSTLRSVAIDPNLRDAMGEAGRLTVERRFDLSECTARLCHVLAAAYG